MTRKTRAKPKAAKRRKAKAPAPRAAKRRRGKKGAVKKAPPPLVLVIRHVSFEDLGSFEPVLKARGYRVLYREAGVDDLAKTDAQAPALLVVLGGPIGAYEDSAYPFLGDEIRLIKARLAAKRPVLGICLGAQLMARALGARVYPGPAKEIGWGAIELTEEGRRSPLRHLAADKTRVLHWHGDTFELPAGATHLAATHICRNQAFALGRHALALQFHPEAPETIERWLIGHAHEIAAAPGVSAEALRADAERYAPALQKQGPKAFAAWLDGAGLKPHIKPKIRR